MWWLKQSPQALANAACATVKVIAVLVARQLMCLAIDGEPSCADAVRKTSDYRPHVSRIPFVLFNAGQLQYQCPPLATDRDAELAQYRPIGQYFGLQAIRCAQRNGFHAATILEPAEMSDLEHGGTSVNRV